MRRDDLMAKVLPVLSRAGYPMELARVDGQVRLYRDREGRLWAVRSASLTFMTSGGYRYPVFHVNLAGLPEDSAGAVLALLDGERICSVWQIPKDRIDAGRRAYSLTGIRQQIPGEELYMSRFPKSAKAVKSASAG